MGKKEKFKWRKQDYFWLIAIILILWYITATVRLGDNSDVVNIISLIASGVSVALAVIAIWWGQVNNNEVSKTYEKIIQTLDSVKNETGEANQKLDEIRKNTYRGIDSIANISEEDKNNIKNIIDDSINKTNWGWTRDDKGWYFCEKDGKPVKGEWKKDGGYWFYLKDDGYIATDKLIKIDDTFYYVDGSGKMCSNGFYSTEKGLMYFNEKGQAFMNGEKTIKGKTYMFKDGVMTEELFNNKG